MTTRWMLRAIVRWHRARKHETGLFYGLAIAAVWLFGLAGAFLSVVVLAVLLKLGYPKAPVS